jgi:hypothetical protein
LEIGCGPVQPLGR